MIISIVNDDGMLQNYNMINDSDNIIALLGSVYCIQVACATYQVQILLPLVFSHDE